MITTTKEASSSQTESANTTDDTFLVRKGLHRNGTEHYQIDKLADLASHPEQGSFLRDLWQMDIQVVSK